MKKITNVSIAPYQPHPEEVAENFGENESTELNSQEISLLQKNSKKMKRIQKIFAILFLISILWSFILILIKS